jgi:pimeloyl-ACP methyl ester carboxylesterase
MKRPLRTCVLALCVAIPASVTAADSPAPPKPDLTLDVYAEPARLVDIGGGRRLNLRCSGPQSPTRTVLLEAGFGGDSMAWARVQPLLAAQLRVCSYDRAGYGFSDGGPLPRSVEAETADLHALVHAAQLPLPMVIVGHSLGSNIARRYDQRYPDDVAGLVLIDPPPQQVGKFSPQYQTQETEMLPQVLAAYRQCEQGARDGRLADPPPELKQCLRAPNPLFSDKLNAAVRASKSRPEFWQTVITGSQAKATLFNDAVDPGEKHGKTRGRADGRRCLCRRAAGDPRRLATGAGGHAQGPGENLRSRQARPRQGLLARHPDRQAHYRGRCDNGRDLHTLIAPVGGPSTRLPPG